MKPALLAAAVALVSLSGPVLAHHGDAGRYVEEVITLNGVVVETQLVNPHAIMVFDVTDATGKTVRWQAELGGAPYMNLTERARVVLLDGGKEVHRTANYGQPAGSTNFPEENAGGRGR